MNVTQFLAVGRIATFGGGKKEKLHWVCNRPLASVTLDGTSLLSSCSDINTLGRVLDVQGNIKRYKSKMGTVTYPNCIKKRLRG